MKKLKLLPVSVYFDNATSLCPNNHQPWRKDFFCPAHIVNLRDFINEVGLPPEPVHLLFSKIVLVLLPIIRRGFHHGSLFFFVNNTPVFDFGVNVDSDPIFKKNAEIWSKIAAPAKALFSKIALILVSILVLKLRGGFLTSSEEPWSYHLEA